MVTSTRSLVLVLTLLLTVVLVPVSTVRGAGTGQLHVTDAGRPAR